MNKQIIKLQLGITLLGISLTIGCATILMLQWEVHQTRKELYEFEQHQLKLDGGIIKLLETK